MHVLWNLKERDFAPPMTASRFKTKVVLMLKWYTKPKQVKRFIPRKKRNSVLKVDIRRFEIEKFCVCFSELHLI